MLGTRDSDPVRNVWSDTQGRCRPDETLVGHCTTEADDGVPERDRLHHEQGEECDQNEQRKVLEAVRETSDEFQIPIDLSFEPTDSEHEDHDGEEDRSRPDQR